MLLSVCVWDWGVFPPGSFRLLLPVCLTLPMPPTSPPATTAFVPLPWSPILSVSVQAVSVSLSRSPHLSVCPPPFLTLMSSQLLFVTLGPSLSLPPQFCQSMYCPWSLEAWHGTANLAACDPHIPACGRQGQGRVPTLEGKAEAWRCAVPCRPSLAGEGGSLGRTPAHAACVRVGGCLCPCAWVPVCPEVGDLPHLPSPYPATE